MSSAAEPRPIRMSPLAWRAGHADAMTDGRWARDTEKAHRDKLAQTERWSPSFVEPVARQIADKTGPHHVCRICGNAVHLVPADS